MNVYISLRGGLFKALGWHPFRPLPAVSDNGQFDYGDELHESLCNRVSRSTLEGAEIMINILKATSDRDKLNRYSETHLKTLFPVMGTRLVEFGSPESEYWDQIALVRYRNRDALCEMALSKIQADIIDLKRQGVADSYTYLTKQIL